MTDDELIAAILMARKFAWVSGIHREELHRLELEARSRNLKI